MVPLEETCRKSALKDFMPLRYVSIRCMSFFSSELNFVVMGWDAKRLGNNKLEAIIIVLRSLLLIIGLKPS